MADRPTNRLAEEHSPYLLQHAHNPVDWYPWSQEAFDKAKLEEKPIFLSIGYSTCHWCHVMERESFEDTAIAEFLNRYFVSIKVDREERPEIDHIYMSAVQAMSGSGGWPMTVFLTPELKPFYAGTYFPPEPAHGRPSFRQLITRIAELWSSDRTALVESADTLTNAIADHTAESSSSVLDAELIANTFEYFNQSFDEQYGGFGRAPKFPRPVQFDFLFNYSRYAKNERARQMALVTLRKIALGGISDHIGGGFHRYSVDRLWKISHFEKMLYDQAQLVNSFLDAYQLSPEHIFSEAAKSTIEYVLRELTHADGGFFSAEDADSEGEEGTYYVWTKAEIDTLLGKDANAFAEYYGITEEGNFEHGKNVLFLSNQAGPNSEKPAAGLLKLAQARSKRIRPLLDDKVLTSWNGLMIGAMARASGIFDREDYLAGAWRAGEFVWHELHSEAGLKHRWRNGESKFDAYLEDYAFLIQGYLELYQRTFEQKWLDRAKILQEEQDRTLWDEAEGGYFMSRAADDVLFRAKTDYDGAEPAGNSIAALNLLRLSVLLEDHSYRDKASALISMFCKRVASHPFAMPQMMVAYIHSTVPSRQILFTGSRETAVTLMRKSLKHHYLPNTAIMFAAEYSAPFARSLASDVEAAYLCENMTCELPVHSSLELDALLASREHRGA